MPSPDLKTDAVDSSLPITGFFFGKDAALSAVPSIYSLQGLADLLNVYAGAASLATSAVAYTWPAIENNRIMTVVMTAGEQVTLPTPVINVILNVKAAPGVNGVTVVGHIDNVAATTSNVPAGCSAQFHGTATTWWVI